MASPARAEDDPKAFEIVSPNAEFALAQASEGAACKVEVKRGASTVLWSARRCFGDRNDGHFLSNDGLTLVVVHAYPSLAAGVKAAVGVSAWFKGAPAHSFEVGRFVRDVKPLVMSRKHFYWVEGTLGQRGVPPGYSQDGKAVELTTLDRRSWSVGFDGKLKKIDMPKPLGR
ncbi:MAG: hypothetical protein QM765_25350 [Myxococcales bacterium]